MLRKRKSGAKITKLSCEYASYHHFLDLGNVSYWDYSHAAVQETDAGSCKRVCLGNCSCKAAFFIQHGFSSLGDCFLSYELLSVAKISRN